MKNVYKAERYNFIYRSKQNFIFFVQVLSKNLECSLVEAGLIGNTILSILLKKEKLKDRIILRNDNVN